LKSKPFPVYGHGGKTKREKIIFIGNFKNLMDTIPGKSYSRFFNKPGCVRKVKRDV
jgi:hypothetical protein